MYNIFKRYLKMKGTIKDRLKCSGHELFSLFKRI